MTNQHLSLSLQGKWIAAFVGGIGGRLLTYLLLFMENSIIFVLTCSLLLFIFVPKISYFRQAKENDGAATNAIRSSVRHLRRISGGTDNEVGSSGKRNSSRLLAAFDESDEVFSDGSQEDKLKLAFIRLERNIPSEIEKLLDGDAEVDAPEALVVLDSPEIRDNLIKEHSMMKKSLGKMRNHLRRLQQSVHLLQNVDVVFSSINKSQVSECAPESKTEEVVIAPSDSTLLKDGNKENLASESFSGNQPSPNPDRSDSFESTNIYET